MRTIADCRLQIADCGVTRRSVVGGLAALIASPALRVFADAPAKPWRIGACDWSIGQRQQIAAFDLAKAVGLDGVQFSFDDPGARYDLRKPEVRDEIAARSAATGVAICSLAMGVLNGVPYATDERAERWVAQCIDIMPAMKQSIVLLAFFGKGDINGNRDAQDAVIARLKRIAPAAEKAGVTLGLETWLNVDDHLRILDAVGSPAVAVYYDTANMHKMGHDIYGDIRRLKGRICEVHCKENAHLLGEGPIDFPRVRDALLDIGYAGWLVIESAIPPGKPIPDAYRHNAKFLRSVFDGKP